MVLVVAHRGLSSSVPENTLLAAHEALAIGADVVEIDVRLSKDGHLVVIHDSDVRRTTNGVGQVSSFTLAELKALDAGAYMGEEFAGESIPTFDEMLELFEELPSDAPGKLLVELKFDFYSRRGLFTEIRHLARKVVEAIHRHKSVRKRIMIQSFVESYLNKVKKLDPKIAVHLLVLPWRALFPSRLFGGVAMGFNPKHDLATKAFVEAAHAQGNTVFVWTVDSVTAMRESIEAGVDGIITNHPGRLQRVMQDMVTQEDLDHDAALIASATSLAARVKLAFAMALGAIVAVFVS